MADLLVALPHRMSYFWTGLLSVDEVRQFFSGGYLAITGATPLMRISHLYKEWDAVRSRYVSSRVIFNNEIALTVVFCGLLTPLKTIYLCKVYLNC